MIELIEYEGQYLYGLDHHNKIIKPLIVDTVSGTGKVICRQLEQQTPLGPPGFPSKHVLTIPTGYIRESSQCIQPAYTFDKKYAAEEIHNALSAERRQLNRKFEELEHFVDQFDVE